MAAAYAKNREIRDKREEAVREKLAVVEEEAIIIKGDNRRMEQSMKGAKIKEGRMKAERDTWKAECARLREEL